MAGCGPTYQDERPIYCPYLEKLSVILDAESYEIEDLRQGIVNKQWVNEEQKKAWYLDFAQRKRNFDKMATGYNENRRRAPHCTGLPEEYGLYNPPKKRGWFW